MLASLSAGWRAATGRLSAGREVAEVVAPEGLEALALAGQPLPLPRLARTGWREMQVFREKDDPDRTSEPFRLPAFLSSADPLQRREATIAEELQLPDPRPGSFARVVRGVLTEEECAQLLDSVNDKGFTPVLVNIGGGRQQLLPEVRDGHRVIADCPQLSDWLLEVLRPRLPETLPDGARLEDLNERCRFLCYTPGQFFAAHKDGRYPRPAGHAKEGDSSRVTVQLYLHDVPEDHGGATTFLFGGGRQLPCQPGAGSVLLFSQDLFHEGSLVKKGLKYTLRTEAMYRSA